MSYHTWFGTQWDLGVRPDTESQISAQDLEDIAHEHPFLVFACMESLKVIPDAPDFFVMREPLEDDEAGSSRKVSEEDSDGCSHA